MKPACYAGQYSFNWSIDPCKSCLTGHYSSTGDQSCRQCPHGLTTATDSATSSLDCKCRANFCSYGSCFVARQGGDVRAECKCDFGYSGERCEFPILLIITCTMVVAIVVIAGLVFSIQRALKFRKVKQAREAELSEMNEAWTVNCTEIDLIERVDSGSPGSYGDVYRARYRDMVVAVKKLKGIMRNWIVEREFEREIQLMKRIRHMNVVLFLGAGRYDEDGCPFLLLEFMQHGALTGVLRNSDVSLSQRQRVLFCLDAAKGLEFLHSLTPPRIHRDIKSNNLLLSEHWILKVADFGSARLVKSRGFSQQISKRRRSTPFEVFGSEARKPLLKADEDMSGNVGAVLWRAPEILSGEPYGTPVDVYR